MILKMNIGDRVRVKRFSKTGKIIGISTIQSNKIIYIVQYNDQETEELFEWEIELV